MSEILRLIMSSFLKHRLTTYLFAFQTYFFFKHATALVCVCVIFVLSVGTIMKEQVEED